MEKVCEKNQISLKGNVEEVTKYKVMVFYGAVLFLLAFVFDDAGSLIKGMNNILLAPSILLTDYMEVGSIGSTFFNSGLLVLLAIGIAYRNKVHMNGALIASIFTLGGFAFFGKNIYNVISIVTGVYIYSRIQREKFSKYILIAYFGTALGPLVSQVSFGLGLSSAGALIVGNIAGVIAGIILPPMSSHFVSFHQGFNLYNVGFTCGIAGTIFMSVIRVLGKEGLQSNILFEDNSNRLFIILTLIFLSQVIAGFFLNRKGIKSYAGILKLSGRLVEDFVVMNGFGVTLMNMGILGLMSVAFVFFLYGGLNGPIIGGILTVVGFGAYGKHPKNIYPVVLGILLAAYCGIWEVNKTGVIITALFGTTLAPIAGRFGRMAGIAAGFLHLAVVMNTGYLHGGMNLYNNGFAGGIVAAVLVPIIEAFKKESRE